MSEQFPAGRILAVWVARCGPMLRSPMSTTGSLQSTVALTSLPSCRTFHQGMNDRWVPTTVYSPSGVSTEATTATRGSSVTR